MKYVLTFVDWSDFMVLAVYDSEDEAHLVANALQRAFFPDNHVTKMFHVEKVAENLSEGQARDLYPRTR